MGNPPRFYTVGTLRYDRRRLVVLFFWLMWNDFSITLLEKIGQLNGFLMKDHGATYTQMATLASIGSILTIWINPCVSTWSDRLRSRLRGRRRPFLLRRYSIFRLLHGRHSVHAGFILFRGSALSYRGGTRRPFPHERTDAFHRKLRCWSRSCSMPSSRRSSVTFTGMWFPNPTWDGSSPCQRSSRSSRAWFGASGSIGLPYTHHMKAVYVGTAPVLAWPSTLISTWRIREGEYPPPDPHTKGGVFAPVRAYFVECFNQPYYLWVFGACVLFQIGNMANGYPVFLLPR